MRVVKDQIIGIVGGMGPEAGVALFNAILKHTNARSDQEHLPVVLMSFPQGIVDRTSFLEGHTHMNPAFSIAEIIMKLERTDARVVGLACNTSYSPAIYDVILEELQKMDSKVRMINMPAETCAYIRDYYPAVRRVGIMTTNGTYRSGVYKKKLLDLGYTVILPDPAFQDEVIHSMIYDPGFGLKSNAGKVTAEVKALLEKALLFFEEKGADAVILGCTELSLIGKENWPTPILLVDSTEVFAKALIREATVHRNIALV